MKHYHKNLLMLSANFLLMISIAMVSLAQDSTDVTVAKRTRPVKSTFESVLLMDNQSVMVPVKGTFEWDIQHRFGTVKNGSKDLFGVFAPANIRLGFNYAPFKRLYIGAGLTKERMQADVNLKYAILQQTPRKMPVSLSFYGNAVMDTRNKSNFRYSVDRYSYFSQLIVARKVTENFSLQVAPSFSWFNNVEGYINSKGEIRSKMRNGHLAISFAGRYKFSPKSGIIFGLDQPLTQHPTNNPHPNICFGLETTSSSHAFQVFFGNFSSILPESNNVLNQNNYRNGEFLLGFNITKVWNF